MELASVLSTADSGESDDEDTTSRCVDCMATFEERRDLCPKCGSETFEGV